MVNKGLNGIWIFRSIQIQTVYCVCKRNHLVESHDFKRYFSDILDLKEHGTLEVIEMDAGLVKMSWGMIIKEHLSAADALHLVTALKKNATVFLAADKKLVAVAEKKGLQAINVEAV